jgi:hypothetical protein
LTVEPQYLLDNLVMALGNAVLFALHPVSLWKYRHDMGRLPNIAHPTRYSERMLWRRLVDHDPQFVVFSDKLATKEYCRSRCPDLLLPETLWVGRDADAIPDELFHRDVVVKTNHGFNYNYPVRGGIVDRADLKQKTDAWLTSVHGVATHQWAYSMVEPKLFVEEAVGDPDQDLLDFSIRAGNGNAILGSVIGHNKRPNSWITYLDLDGNPTAGPDTKVGDKPNPLPEGIEIQPAYGWALRHARRLSAGVDYARFDFMWNGTNLYGGEITVYPAAGSHEITNPAVHAAIVNGWDLKCSHFLRTSHSGLVRMYAGALKRRS